MNKFFGALASIMLAGGLFCAQASAQQPAQFNFVFEDPNSSATATGFIVFDLNLLPNPGSAGGVALPDPLVLDLQVTVTGSAEGDGVFTLGDFTGVVWDTGGLALDLSPGTQVLGQPTSGGTWGPDGCMPTGPQGLGGGCGDFNLFTQPFGPAVQGEDPYAERGGPVGAGPQGVAPFRLAANGGSGEAMELTSFMRGTAPAPVSVPTLSVWSVTLFAVLLLTIGWVSIRLRG